MLLGDPWGRRGTDESGERRQPDGDGRWVVIDDVVHAGRCREDVCSVVAILRSTAGEPVEQINMR